MVQDVDDLRREIGDVVARAIGLGCPFIAPPLQIDRFALARVGELLHLDPLDVARHSENEELDPLLKGFGCGVTATICAWAPWLSGTAQVSGAPSVTSRMNFWPGPPIAESRSATLSMLSPVGVSLSGLVRW